MMQLQDKTVLLTGGAGLIGSHIADQLLDEKVGNIRIYDNLSRGSLENLASAMSSGRVELIKGDLRDVELLRESMKGVDVVFHLAAIRITSCAKYPRQAHEVLGTGSLNVLEAAVLAGVHKLVASSSASIYGQAESFPTNERHHPYGNDTLYGALKSYLEGMLRSFCQMYGMNYVALRYFNVYGPRMDTEGKYTEVLIRWMERIEAGKAPIIFGDGSQTMDFVFVEDIARANICAARADISDRVYNVARGEEISLKQLALTLCKVMGAEHLTPEYQDARGVGAVTRRLASIEAAELDLGFSAQIDLERGLRKLVDWWREKTSREGTL